jgi:hypothetical protein
MTPFAPSTKRCAPCRCRSPPPTSRPASSRCDGTSWQIGPGDLATVAAWSVERPVALTCEGLLRRLVYEDDGSAVLVCEARVSAA